MKLPSVFTGMPSLLEQTSDFAEYWPVERNLPSYQIESQRSVNSDSWLMNIPNLIIRNQDESSLNQEKKPRVKKCKKITKCPHVDRKHYAKSMCSNCYHFNGRSEKATKCEHQESTMYAKGLCLRCYQRTYKRLRSKARKNSGKLNN